MKPITYYSWRKKRGVAVRRGRRGLAILSATGDIGVQVRTAVQSRIRQVLPAIVKSEVGSYMSSLFGNIGGGGRRRRRTLI